MNYLDLQVDFFIPVWRRVVLLVCCFGWSLFEFISGAAFWGVIFGGMGGYAAWQLFFSGWPDAESVKKHSGS